MKSALTGLARSAVAWGCLALLAACQTTETTKSPFGKAEKPPPQSAVDRLNNTLYKADDKIQDVLWGPQQ